MRRKGGGASVTQRQVLWIKPDQPGPHFHPTTLRVNLAWDLIQGCVWSTSAHWTFSNLLPWIPLYSILHYTEDPFPQGFTSRSLSPRIRCWGTLSKLAQFILGVSSGSHQAGQPIGLWPTEALEATCGRTETGSSFLKLLHTSLWPPGLWSIQINNCRETLEAPLCISGWLNLCIRDPWMQRVPLSDG